MLRASAMAARPRLARGSASGDDPCQLQHSHRRRRHDGQGHLARGQNDRARAADAPAAPRVDCGGNNPVPCMNAVPRLSVIVPALNEAERLAATLAAAASPGVELLVVDGDSSDGTPIVAATHGARVVTSPPGRGRQLAAGVAAASADLLLFVHADCRLPADYATLVAATLAVPTTSVGAFRLAVDAKGLRFRMIEWLVRCRCWLFRMPYGDQALFVRRSTYEQLGGFATLEAMEDFDFVRRAKHLGRVVVRSEAVVTSPRAWRRHGVLRLSAWNLGCALAAALGVAPARIAGWRVRRGLAAGRLPADAGRTKAETASLPRT